MCQKYDGMPLITIPLIRIQMRLPWGILHMALTHGLMIYYVLIRPETAGEKNVLIAFNRAAAC